MDSDSCYGFDSVVCTMLFLRFSTVGEYTQRIHTDIYLKVSEPKDLYLTFALIFPRIGTYQS